MPRVFDENLGQHAAQPRQLGLHVGVVRRQNMIGQAPKARRQPILGWMGGWMGRFRGSLNFQEHIRRVETLGAAGAAEGGLSAAAVVDAQLFEDADR